MFENSIVSFWISQPIFEACRNIFSFLFLTNFIGQAHAIEPQVCTSIADKYINSTHDFSLNSWLNRDICMRANNNLTACNVAFVAALKELDKLREREYADGPIVLALLPAAIALLGTPSKHIGRLLNVIPFAGGLAMTLSFGVAMLQPERLEDIENDSNRYKVASKRSAAIIARGSESSNNAQEAMFVDLDEVGEKILQRLCQEESQRLMKKFDLWVGLILLIVLSVGAQTAMIVAEQRGVIPWWMHLWYILGKEFST